MLRKLPFVTSLMYVPLQQVEVQHVMRALTIRYVTEPTRQNNEDQDYQEEQEVDANNREIICYDLSVPGYIGVPRTYGIENMHVGRFTDCTVPLSRDPSKFVRQIKPRDNQQKEFMETLAGLVQGPAPVDIVANARTGCHVAGTLILKYNGTTVPVEEIKVGDELMGPDSKPRMVLELVTGQDDMYCITPHTGGPSFVVNAGHILSLVRTREFFGEYLAVRRLYQRANEVVDIPLFDYLSRSNKFKHLHKLYRCAVDFPVIGMSLRIDPYVLGLWLGDGSSKTPSFTTMDKEIYDAICVEADNFGVSIREATQVNNRSKTYFLTNGNSGGKLNAFLESLRWLDVLGNKHIPFKYKCGSRETRLAVLAGLIDTDGHLTCGCYELVLVNRRLVTDAIFVARSLGFCVSEGIKIVNGVTYYRLHISGDISIVPVRLLRKKALPRRQKKNPLRSGFTVEPLSKGYYYGFVLDGDHRYLTADFTVHHNTGKTLSALWLVENAIQSPTLVVVPTTFLLGQWRDRISQFMGRDWYNTFVGHVQQSTMDYKGRLIVLGVMKSLAFRTYPLELRRYFSCLIIDEMHKVPTPSMSSILAKYPASIRIGMTATNRRDVLHKVSKFHLGAPRVKSQQEVMQPHIRIVKYNARMPLWMEIYNERYMVSILSKRHDRNKLLCDIILDGFYRNRHIVALSDRTDQLVWMLDYISEHIDGSFVGLLVGKYRYNGETISMKRHEQKFVADHCQIILATYGIFDTGADVDRLDMGIECTPRGNVRQGIGRILRIKPGKPAPEWVSIHDHIMVYPDAARAAPMFAGSLVMPYKPLHDMAQARESSFHDQRGIIIDRG